MSLRDGITFNKWFIIQFESRVYYAEIHNQPLVIASTIGLLS